MFTQSRGWLKSSTVESSRPPCRKGLSWSSQEKLNLSQLPFLLSSPSKKYACVEILNCPSVVLALVNVPPPTHAARAVTLRRHATLARRQTAAAAASGPQISNVSVKARGSMGPPSPKTTRRFARRPTPVQTFLSDDATMQDWVSKRNQRHPVLLLLQPPAALYNVSSWSVVFSVILSPQMCCVQTWRFKPTGSSPTAPVMVLKRCQVCAKCRLSCRNTLQSATLDKVWTFSALPHWACLNLTNHEMGTLYIYMYMQMNTFLVQIFSPIWFELESVVIYIFCSCLVELNFLCTFNLLYGAIIRSTFREKSLSDLVGRQPTHII